MKTLILPSTGKQVCMGRKRPIAKCPTLHLKRYLRKALPVPTLPFDYSSKALPSLRNIYGNDTLGDCVIAGGFHIRGVTSGNAGTVQTFTNNQVIQDYSAIGGYVPGNPSTDQGCDEQTACNYWTQTGFPDGVKLAGWMAIDPNSVSELQTALYLFENLYFGLELPDAWVNPMPSGDGFIWDVAGAPDPNNGHCVIGYGATQQGILIDTWAMFGTLTYNAIADYCSNANGGNVYVLLSPDMLVKSSLKSPQGVDWPTLIADFDSMGGNIPAVTPVPPTPTPTPPVPVTPPGPTPSPVPSIKAEIDSLMQSLETYYHNWPAMQGFLKALQTKIDQILSSYSQNKKCFSYTETKVIPPNVLAIITAALAALENVPEFAPYVTAVQAILAVVGPWL